VGKRIYVDHEHHTIWLNGYEIRGLTPLEYKLVAYLEKKQGQVCTRDELAQYLYPDDVAGIGVADNRIDSVVKRLRKRIEPNPKEPQYIVTRRGHGFRLVDGN
jgi:two-component system alkaline phosphatase synthesis response regulator PhoP